MSLPRFFLDSQVLSDEGQESFRLRLSDDDRKHARVLRLQPGEHIVIIDAGNDYFECEIVSFDDDMCVRIAHHEGTREQAAQVVLVQGLAKGDKFDEVLRHASEIGVSAFVPLVCERSVVKLDAAKTASRMKRWEAILKSAAMQAGLDAIPELSEPLSVSQAADMLTGATCVVVCWEEARACSIGSAIETALEKTRTPRSDARVAIIVGPEGGLTQDEVNTLSSCNDNAFIVSLGPTILRTETAGVVAPALAIYELGGLQ